MGEYFMSRRTFARLAAAGFGTAALAGCAPGSQTQQAVQPAGGDISGDHKLTWGWRLPTTWDSAMGIGYDVHVNSLVYSGLTRLDPEGSLAPDLAESWAYHDAGDKVTFQLREGLEFSDGTVLDATAVKAGLERNRDLPGGTSGQSLAIIEEITADSATEVTLHLKEVSHQLPLLLAGLIGHLASPGAIDSGADLAVEPVGAGPFVVESYVPGSHATLRRNPTHWNADEILLDELRVVERPAEAVAYAGLSSGQYDLAHIDDTQIRPLEDAGFRVDGGRSFNVYTIQINNRHPPFDDPLVVEAFNRAIDREGLVEGPLAGFGWATWQPFAPGIPGHDPELDQQWNHDPDRARQLLEEAGHSAGIAVTMHVIGEPNNEPAQRIAEAVQDQVAAAGFDLTLEIAPPGAGQKAAHSYTLHMYSFSGRESPVQALEVLYSEEGWMNISQQATDDFTDALERAQRTPLDSSDYAQNLEEATGAATSGASTHAWLINWNRSHAMNDRVTGFTHCLHTQRFEGVGVRA